MAKKLSKSDTVETSATPKPEPKPVVKSMHFEPGTYVIYKRTRYLVETVLHCKCARGDRTMRLLNETTGERINLPHPMNKPGGHGN